MDGVAVAIFISVLLIGIVLIIIATENNSNMDSKYKMYGPIIIKNNEQKNEESIQQSKTEVEETNTSKTSEQPKKNRRLEMETKGTEFENYVKSMFKEDNFKLIHETPHRDENGKLPDGVKNPDFRFIDKKTQRVFWVECKYRTYPDENGKVHWCDKYQRERYQDIEKESKSPVFVIIGFGNCPNNPKEIFCMNVKDMEFNAIFLNTFRKHMICDNIESYEDLEKIAEVLT